MWTLVDVDPSARTKHGWLGDDNPADGGAGPGIHEREQNFPAHSVTLFQLYIKS